MEANLQKNYTLNLVAVLMVCIWLMGYATISIFSVSVYDGLINVWVTLATVLVFFVTGLAFQASNKNRILRLPSFLPKTLIIALQLITGIAFILSVLYAGAFAPPQIWQTGNTFSDRVGHEYTYSQFQESQKQQLMLLTAFSVFALLFTITFPFYDRRTKKWLFS
jgi:hypothetical protein